MRQPDPIATIGFGVCAVLDAMRLCLEQRVAIQRMGIRDRDRHAFCDERRDNLVPRCAEDIGSSRIEKMWYACASTRGSSTAGVGCETRHRLQAVSQPRRSLVPPPNVIRETFELRQQQRRLKPGQTGVGAKPDMLVPGAAGASPLVGDRPRGFRQVRIVGKQHAPLTRCEVLARLKAEGPERTETADRPAAPRPLPARERSLRSAPDAGLRRGA